ncbi:MAG: nucleoside deaminase [Clostridiales bacterium]|nr:nucleoside deaminase [Clostridiales bacterium]
MNKFMQEAIEEAKKGITCHEGGPFGAVIVKNGKIISRSHNQVVSHNDPTAHAEMQAIRKACEKLNTFNLKGCEIYSTGEPCPMCYSAIHWARIDKIYYGCSRKDAAEIGFDDQLLYDVLKGQHPDKQIESKQIERKSCLEPFKKWQENDSKTPY